MVFRQDESNKAGIIYIPGIEALVKTKDFVAIMNQKPHDWLHRLRLGMRMLDENALMNGKLTYSKQKHPLCFAIQSFPF